jgi:hypothetical protein
MARTRRLVDLAKTVEPFADQWGTDGLGIPTMMDCTDGRSWRKLP